MPRDLILACVASIALSGILAAVLERAWTAQNRYLVELQQ